MPYGYVCNTGSDSVTKIDLSTFTVSGSPLAVTGAWKIVIDSGTAFAYVTGSSTGLVYQIDLSTFTVVNSVAVIIGSAYCDEIAIDPPETYLYVSSAGLDHLYQIDISTFTVTNSLFLGYQSIGICIDPTNTYAWVIAEGIVGGIYLLQIELSTFTIVTTTAVDTFLNPVPWGIAIDSLGSYAYILCDSSTYSAVIKFDLSTLSVVTSGGGSSVPGSADGIIIDSTDTNLYFTAGNADEVTSMTLSPFTIGASGNPPSPSAEPRQVTIDETNTYIYTADNTGNTVTKFDNSLTPISSIAVGTAPLGITARPHIAPPVVIQQILIM